MDALNLNTKNELTQYFKPGAEGLLQPLSLWLKDKDVSEILINQPGEIYVERFGKLSRIELPALTRLHLKRLGIFIANENSQHLTVNSPILAGNLYNGARVQVIMPPAAKNFTLSIRKPSIKAFVLDDYKKNGFYNNTIGVDADFKIANFDDENKRLISLYRKQDWSNFIESAIKLKKNIVISGETSSGKTTFLNACMEKIPKDTRIITIEDTFELNLCQPNKVSLLAFKKSEGQTLTYTMQDLVQAALRLRPDRIIMGEIRGKEILDFISACSTGHEGSITTIHASNPNIAFMRMVQMYKLNNVPGMSDADIEKILHMVIDIILQVKKTKNGRELVHVYFKHALNQ